MIGAPFSLYFRKSSRVWYARFRLPTGAWSSARSTGCAKKREAIAWCQAHVRQHGQPLKSEGMTFAAFARGFFDEGGLWQRSLRAHRGSVRGAHLRNQRARLRNYLIPHFGTWKLHDITAGDVDRALLYIKEHARPKRRTETGKLSPRTVNALHAALSAIFDEAVRQGFMRENPMRSVPRLSERSKARGILSAAELRLLLDPATADEIWQHERYYLIALIAITTAARSGEIRTLHREDVKPDHLVLRRSWDDVDGLTSDTKTGIQRTVPLHPVVYRALTRWADGTGVESGYLFPSPDVEGAPIDRDSVLKNFRGSLERAGISRAEQKRRNLTFHGLRHAAATLAISAGVNRNLVRLMTGHKSDAVFDRYLDHRELADWKPIEEWQGGMLEGGQNG